MTKRYRETLDEVELEHGRKPGEPRPAGRRGPRPSAFHWRGRRYQVVQVLGHWREDPGWWHGAASTTPADDSHSNRGAVRIEQTDLWRVEASRDGGGRAGRGVYELVHRAGKWRLDRVWD